MLEDMKTRVKVWRYKNTRSEPLCLELEVQFSCYESFLIFSRESIMHWGIFHAACVFIIIIFYYYLQTLQVREYYYVASYTFAVAVTATKKWTAPLEAIPKIKLFLLRLLVLYLATLCFRCSARQRKMQKIVFKILSGKAVFHFYLYSWHFAPAQWIAEILPV